MSGLLLDPLQTSVRMTCPLLKAYWGAFLAPLLTKSTRKCQEMLLKLKILFAYVPVTHKHPQFGHGHHMYIHTQNVREECCSMSSTDHNPSLHAMHDVAWCGYIEISQKGARTCGLGFNIYTVFKKLPCINHSSLEPATFMRLFIWNCNHFKHPYSSLVAWLVEPWVSGRTEPPISFSINASHDL